MKLALAADHAGYELKQMTVRHLEAAGHEVLDMGTDSDQSVDYPAYAIDVAGAVAAGKADRGILVCGTGLGMCITANKIAGIRAVGPCSAEQAEMSRRHNDANVLCLGQRMMEDRTALDILDVWLSTGFEGGRHARRLGMISELEKSWPAAE